MPPWEGPQDPPTELKFTSVRTVLSRFCFVTPRLVSSCLVSSRPVLTCLDLSRRVRGIRAQHPSAFRELKSLKSPPRVYPRLSRVGYKCSWFSNALCHDCSSGIFMVFARPGGESLGRAHSSSCSSTQGAKARVGGQRQEFESRETETQKACRSRQETHPRRASPSSGSKGNGRRHQRGRSGGSSCYSAGSSRSSSRKLRNGTGLSLKFRMPAL